MQHSFFIVLYILVHYIKSEEVCPHKVLKDDQYNLVNTFNNFRQAVGNKLSVHHYHTEADRKDEHYTYTINLCAQRDSAAVTQEDPTIKDPSKKMKALGKADDSSILLGGENWLFLQYFHGDTYTSKNHCGGKPRQSWLSIRCEDQGESPALKVIEEARFNTGKDHIDTPCYYLFEYNHPTLCTEKSHKKLSGGAIFLIILFSLAAAYLIFGFMYKRFVKGAKGFDQIPNYAFWRMVGNASADGCDYVCRREERSTTYKGMADALDIDSDEDDKDDGLLPM